MAAMPAATRSLRPTCPACGFAVFNRRCAKCEKCGVELPASIAYTKAEIAGLQAQERVDEEKRAKRLQKAREDRDRRALGPVRGNARSSPIVDAVDGALDLSDLLNLGGD